MLWINIYWVIHYFFRGGVKMAIFTWDSKPNYRGLKMTSERWQHYNAIYTQRLVGLLVKSVDFSCLCCIICQWWPFKNGKDHFSSFFSKVCMYVTWRCPFGIFMSKALYGSVPEILAFQYGFRSNCTHFQWSKTKCESLWNNMTLLFF